MAPFRPANLNKRLVSSTGGNGGVIGPTKTPYCLCGQPGQIALGCRCFGGGSCAGRFTLSESFCGVSQSCGVDTTDCKGFFICCGPGTAKWFIAPSCTEIGREWDSRSDAVPRADLCMGACGWFIPTCAQLFNIGFPSRSYWDCYQRNSYWSDTEAEASKAWLFHFDFGFGYCNFKSQGTCNPIRTLRCTAT